jgi:NDP-hexose 2,3-enoyl reductase
LLQQPAVASVMIGPSSVTQLEQALTAGSLKLDVAQLARLDEIFPPIGPAPEAYAW